MSCAVIINRDYEYLLIQRAREPEKKKWSLISGIGGSKKGLPPCEAVQDEVRHDIGVDFIVEKHCFDYPLQEWFEFKIPRTKVAPDYIQGVLHEDENFAVKPTAKIVWLGGNPSVSHFTKSKKGRDFEMMALTFHDKRESFTIQVPQEQGEWLKAFLGKNNNQPTTYAQAKSSYETMELEDFELFWFSKPMAVLREHGLLVL